MWSRRKLQKAKLKETEINKTARHETKDEQEDIKQQVKSRKAVKYKDEIKGEAQHCQVRCEEPGR